MIHIALLLHIATVETQRVQFKRLPRVHDETLGYEVSLPNKRLTAERLHKLSELGFCWSAKQVRKTGSTGNLVSSGSVTAPTPVTTHTPSPMSTCTAITVPLSVSLLPATTCTFASTYPALDSSRGNGNQTRMNADAQWKDYYTRLALFKERYGHVLVPRKYEEDPKLAAWVETQRALWNRDFNQSKDKRNTALSAAYTNTDQSWATTNKAALSQHAALLPTTRRLTLERKEQLDALGFVWSLRSKRIDDHWHEMFNQLVDYKNQHGDCLVPSRYEANLKLGKWVETQRYEYTKLQRAATSDNNETVLLPTPSNGTTRIANPRLTPERLRRLESLGFEWKVKNKMKRYYDKQWDFMFQKLLDFKQQYGHVNVPKRYPENIKLGTWVHTQRIQYRKLIGGNSTMCSKEKGDDESPLNGIEEQGSSPPYTFPEETYEGGPSAWTVEQAQSYRLTDERRKRLEEVGFCWSAREGNDKATLEPSERITRNSYDDQWDAMFDLLVRYKQQQGDCLVPKRYTANPKLGTWVDTQRVQYKKLLKKIAQNQHQKQSVDEGKNDHNATMDDNASIGSTGKDSSSNVGTPLVGRLTQERIQRLQNLGFVWSLRDDWAKHYEELKVYKQIHGHCNVPARYAENRRLGIWVSAQRQQFKILQQQSLQPNEHPHTASIRLSDSYFSVNDHVNGTITSDSSTKARRPASLTQERIDLLNALGFTWTIRSRDSLGESWNQRLHELRMFKQQYGHCLVPSRYEGNPELGVWVVAQRTQYRIYMRSMETGVPVATNMNEDRIRELEYLGFVWALRGTAQEETFAPVESASTVDLSDGVAGVVALATDHHSVVKDYDLHQNNHHSDHDTNSINQGISSEHNAPNTKVENEYLVTI